MMPNQPRESGITQNNGVIEDHWGESLCGCGPGHLTDVHWPGDPTAEAFFPSGMDVTSFV